MIHLYQCQCHDEGYVWCGAESWDWTEPTTDEVTKATCRECLTAATDLGLEASLTLFALKSPP